MNASESYDFHPPTIDPYRRGLLAPLGLTLLALLATLATGGLFALGLLNGVFFAIAVSFLLLFGVMALSVWLWGSAQQRRAAAFLASDRPLVRWTYTPREWERLQAAAWEEEGGDWKVQLGCLTVLLAITGALTGLLIGLDEGLLPALVGSGLGLAAGGLLGGVIGMVVAGGNHLGARLAQAQTTPGIVALAPNEVYALGNYFRGDGRSSYVRRVTLYRDAPLRLHLEIQLPPRVRGPVEEAWMLPVPAPMLETVEASLPQLTPSTAVP